MKSACGGTTAFMIHSSGRGKAAANDKVVLGIMGTGGRGTLLVDHLIKRDDIEIAYLCDVNVRQFGRAAELIVSAKKKRPKLVKDFREMLDDSGVDAIINATPDHWHALGTIMACQAGKDVYVEKPLSLTVWEGRKMIEAARKYKRIVQVGTQSRSARYIRDAVDYVRAGNLGDIYFVRVHGMMKLESQPKSPAEPVPTGLDWDMWCGPSEKMPYSPGRWWFNMWEYCTGGIASDLVHQLDIARFLIGESYPKSAYNAAKNFYFQDGREIPDSQIATFEYDNLIMNSESALWMPYMQKTAYNIRDANMFPEWLCNSTRVELYGTKALMCVGRLGGGWQVFASGAGDDASLRKIHIGNKIIASQYGRQSTDEHLENFIDCVRSRKKPNADVEEGHYSALLAHLANISYRAGNKKLEFDSKTETITNNRGASGYLTKSYRKPWVIPEKV